MFHVLLIILDQFLLANGGHLHLYNPTVHYVLYWEYCRYKYLDRMAPCVYRSRYWHWVPRGQRSGGWTPNSSTLRTSYWLSTVLDINVDTGSFSKAGFSQEAVNQLLFGLFCCFLDYFHSKIWAPFHFGTFEPYKQEKSW